MRVLYFGMEGAFSGPPLAALLTAGCAPCAVVVPRPRDMTGAAPPIRRLAPPRHSPLGVVNAPADPTIIGLAWTHAIPVLEVGSPADPRVVDALAAFRPDLICVACFPRLLPRAVLALPRLGALNVHPSLLPAYRGPAPLFWVFHDGLEHAGVTVHLVDAGADSGAIAACAPLDLPDGVGYGAAERIAASAGARLLLQAIHTLETGRLEAHPQGRLAASRAPLPRRDDFVITPAWAARRAFNFIRGMAEWGCPIELRVTNRRWAVRDAVRYDEQASLSEPLVRCGPHTHVRCAPGVLVVTLDGSPI